jgi:hypothetical protein
MSAEKSPIKRESIALSLCYYWEFREPTPCPRRNAKVRPV